MGQHGERIHRAGSARARRRDGRCVLQGKSRPRAVQTAAPDHFRRHLADESKRQSAETRIDRALQRGGKDMSDTLRYDQVEHVVTLTLDRPETRNALTDADMVDAFVRACERASA